MHGRGAVPILALTVSVLAGAEAGGDADAEWALLVAEGRGFHRAGDYAGAERSLAQAVRLTEGPGSSLEVHVLTLGELAVAVQAQGRLSEARRLFLQALAHCDGIPDADRYCKAGLLGGLASAHIDAGEYAKAEPLLHKAIALAESATQAALQARFTYYLASIRYFRGALEQAEPYLLRALDLCDQAGDPDIQLKAGILSNLAVLWMETGRTAAAASLFEQVIRLIESGFGPAHPLLVKPWGNLGLCLSVLGRHKDALAAASKAMAIAESALGPEHFITGQVLMQCADVFRKAGRNGEARRLEKRGREVLARHERDNMLGHTLDQKAYASSPARR